MDLYTGKIIVYKVSAHIDTHLAIGTPDAAFAACGKCHSVIFHTDRGCRFAAKAFQKRLDEMGMI